MNRKCIKVPNENQCKTRVNYCNYGQNVNLRDIAKIQKDDAQNIKDNSSCIMN